MYQNVISTLVELFEKYKEQGVLSIYLHGSVTGSDYSSKVSDVDSVAFVDESTPLVLEAEMINHLKILSPHIPKFSIRFVYLSELKTGTSKGYLTKYIYPPSLILDFPYWKHVIGKVVDPRSFLGVTYADGIRDRLERIDRERWLDEANVSEKSFVYYLKNIARLIWFIDQADGRRSAFSYETIAPGKSKYRNIAQAIFKIKQAGWDFNLFKESQNLFQDFVKEILSQYK